MPRTPRTPIVVVLSMIIALQTGIVACGGAPGVGFQMQQAGLPMATIGQARIPTNLAPLTASVLVRQARPWRADAIPVMAEIEEILPQSGTEYQLVLYFMSPTDRAGLRVVLSSAGIRTRESANVRWGDRALPVQFMDLAPLLEAAYADGMTGNLRQASLSVWDGGPAWQILPRGPQGRTYSALTGQRIEGDVTGYVADYNQQWEEAIAGIMALAETATSTSNPYMDDISYHAEVAEAMAENNCERSGGRYDYGVCF